MSLLHVACSYGHLPIVLLLLSQKGALINQRDSEGWTPLHCACAEGHVDIVKALIRCGTQRTDGNEDLIVDDAPLDLDAENFDGETPEDIVLDANRDEILGLLTGKLCDLLTQ